MARALVWHHRTPTGGWRPVAVFLASRRRLDARCLAGDTDRARWFEAILADAQRPQREPYRPERGTWEDWVEWALTAHSNGHDSMMVEVDPEPTTEALYRREVLGISPKINTPPSLRPAEDLPPLTGVKADKVRPNQPTARA